MKWIPEPGEKILQLDFDKGETREVTFEGLGPDEYWWKCCVPGIERPQTLAASLLFPESMRADLTALCQDVFEVKRRMRELDGRVMEFNNRKARGEVA